MVALHERFFGLYLIFGQILQAADAISLSNIQSVEGFSEACTNAYATPLTSCKGRDFVGGQPCSQECIKNLDDLTTIIHDACQGARATLDTLMGLFFISEGTAAICPNARELTGSDAAGGIEEQPTATVTSNLSPSNVPDQTKDSLVGNSESTASSSTTSISLGPPGATSATLTTSAPRSDPLIQSVTTIPLSALTAPSTTETALSETAVMAPKLKATFGGGGGTPFDVTSSSHHNYRPMRLAMLVMVCFVALAWLV